MRTEQLSAIFHSGVDAVDPYKLVFKAMRLNGDTVKFGGSSYYLNGFRDIIVVGAGKATARMAKAVEELLGDRIGCGLIIVKYGHAADLRIITQREAGHPVPDSAGVRGTEEVIRLVQGVDEKTLVICLVSGGASSLFVSPAEGLTLEDKQEVTKILLSAGADIDELNTVRKHLSRVKGGRFAQIVSPATLVTMVLSDVIGDRLDVIASGPTVPDSTTFQDAMDVIKRYGLEDKLPQNAIKLLRQGFEGKVDDTPKKGDMFFRTSNTIVIGDLGVALATAKDKAVSMGLSPEIHATDIRGEAKDAAAYLAKKAIRTQDSMKQGDRAKCLLSGGETTVTVRGKGLGGRNQELALAFAVNVEGVKGITMLSAGTDGTDGPTDAAGAIVDGYTSALAKRLGAEPTAYLNNNDSYNFFKNLDLLSGRRHHLITGPTGTNVMDMQIICVEA